MCSGRSSASLSFIRCQTLFIFSKAQLSLGLPVRLLPSCFLMISGGTVFASADVAKVTWQVGWLNFCLMMWPSRLIFFSSNMSETGLTCLLRCSSVFSFFRFSLRFRFAALDMRSHKLSGSCWHGPRMLSSYLDFFATLLGGKRQVCCTLLLWVRVFQVRMLILKG